MVFVPEMIRFYLGEEPLLDNVPTWRCALGGRLRLCPRSPPDLVVKRCMARAG